MHSEDPEYRNSLEKTSGSRRISDTESIIRDGILLIDKPSGMTSHDVVALLRRKLRIKKVGHAGTLDPMATGLLIILLGKFTKQSDTFLNYDKEYAARLCLGDSRDTADREGKVIEKKDPALYAEKIKDLENIFASFKGETLQVPPMFSAKKVKGKKLYELARKGVTIKREPRQISIKEIKVTKKEIPYVDFYLRCSKGTYVRQLAHDIGERIGCGAHLDRLRRTKIGPFSVSRAVKIDKDKLYENILQP